MSDLARVGGTCFGFEPKSALDFSFLRTGTGAPLLVQERDDQSFDARGQRPLLEWSVPGSDPLHVRLYGGGSRFDLWIDRGGWFSVDTDVPSIDVPAGVDAIRREERLWGLPALLCFWARGDIALHAAAVEIDGGAVLLAAPGRFGKTTLATAFLAAGHRVLSEDLSRCSFAPDPVMLPGPALLKVRRDAYDRLDVQGASIVAEDRERVHLATDPTHRGDGGPVPLRAIVLLNEADGAPAFGRVDPVDAIQQLWVLAFNLPTDEGRARCFGDLVRLTQSVPVWRLDRPFNYESLTSVIGSLTTFFRA